MTIKLFIEPCRHYMCFKCFANQPNYCQICDIEVQKCEEVAYNREFVTCDIDTCYRFFDTEQKLKDHLLTH